MTNYLRPDDDNTYQPSAPYEPSYYDQCTTYVDTLEKQLTFILSFAPESKAVIDKDKLLNQANKIFTKYESVDAAVYARVQKFVDLAINLSSDKIRDHALNVIRNGDPKEIEKLQQVIQNNPSYFRQFDTILLQEAATFGQYGLVQTLYNHLHISITPEFFNQTFESINTTLSKHLSSSDLTGLVQEYLHTAKEYNENMKSCLWLANSLINAQERNDTFQSTLSAFNTVLGYFNDAASISSTEAQKNLAQFLLSFCQSTLARHNPLMIAERTDLVSTALTQFSQGQVHRSLAKEINNFGLFDFAAAQLNSSCQTILEKDIFKKINQLLESKIAGSGSEKALIEFKKTNADYSAKPSDVIKAINALVVMHNKIETSKQSFFKSSSKVTPKLFDIIQRAIEDLGAKKNTMTYDSKSNQIKWDTTHLTEVFENSALIKPARPRSGKDSR